MAHLRTFLWAYGLLHLALLLGFTDFRGEPLSLLLPGEVSPHFTLSLENFQARPWTLLTYGVMHGGLIHLLLNGLALVVLTQVFLMDHRWREFAAVYGVALLGSGAAILLLDPTTSTVGASGAIFGLIGYLTLSHKSFHLRTPLLRMVALNALLPLLLPVISWEGHLGGLLTGLGLAALANRRAYKTHWASVEGFFHTLDTVADHPHLYLGRQARSLLSRYYWWPTLPRLGEYTHFLQGFLTHLDRLPRVSPKPPEGEATQAR